MNAGILSIRNVLCGVIGLIGLLITVLMGNAAHQAYQRNAAAQRIAAISLLDKALFEGMQHFRFERGTMDLILSLEPDKNGREVGFALTHRRGVDSALGVAFGGLEGLHIAGLGAAVDKLRAEYQDFKAARERADSMADLPLEARDKAFKAGFMARTARLQTSIEAVSSILELEMRRLDPMSADLILAKTMAWTARSVLGASILAFNNAIAGHRGFTPGELAMIEFSQDRVAIAWDLVQRIAEDPKVPGELKAAYDGAQAGFFSGPFADLYAKTFDALSNGRDPEITLSAWRERTAAPQMSVGNVSLAAMDLITRHARDTASQDQVEAICLVAALLVTMTIAGGGLAIVLFRVGRPIKVMTEVMRRLAADDLDVDIPNVGRRDEIGGIAAAVQVFKANMVRHRALEAEAIQAREEAIALAGVAAQERDRAEAASKAKSDFLASMSYELRTPLNAILGYAQILSRDKGLGERIANGLATILSSGRHLLALINDLLDLSKIEADRLELAPHPMNLMAFLANVADIIRIKAEEKGLTFVCETAPDLPACVGEITRAIPVIFMSALSEARNKVEGFEAGAVDYITKPVEITEVLVRLRTHLALRSMQFRLESLSISDPLTGLANRRRFDEVLRSEWLRALRGKTNIGAVMIDIDHFKRYNDHYGHVCGDRCLCAVAKVLEASVRQDVDLAVRYGGEEFVLILPGADCASAAEVAARAHAAILALREPHATSPSGYVTISAGAVSLAPTDEMGAGRLVELADAALYRAKQQGRNQVALYDAASRSAAVAPPGLAPCDVNRLDPLAGDVNRQLQWTLLDSRQRWRDLAIMAADIVFETDKEGRLTFIAPDPALGWPSALLLDHGADMLLSANGRNDCFNPFRVTTSVRRRRTWFKRPDGSAALLGVTASPLFDETGQAKGVRGVGVDWVDYDEFPLRVAADLRRGQLLEYVLQRIGQERGASSRIDVALGCLMHALGAEGAAVIEVCVDAGAANVVYQAGDAEDDIVRTAAALLAKERVPQTADAGRGKSILVARCPKVTGDSVVGAAFWRGTGCRGWDHDDIQLISAAIGLIDVVLSEVSRPVVPHPTPAG